MAIIYFQQPEKKIIYFQTVFPKIIYFLALFGGSIAFGLSTSRVARKLVVSWARAVAVSIIKDWDLEKEGPFSKLQEKENK